MDRDRIQAFVSYDFLTSNNDQFKQVIDYIEKLSLQFLSITSTQGGEKKIILSSNAERNSNRSEVLKYNSYVYSNIAIVFSTTKAIFDLIDVEVENLSDDQKTQMKQEMQEIFESTKSDFINKSNSEDILNANQEAKKLQEMQVAFNTKIYKLLRKNNLHHDCQKKIRILRAMNNMLFNEKIIETQVKISKRYTRIIREEPISSLSNKMKGEVKSIDANNFNTYPYWYKSLNDFQKKVFHKYQKEIASGKTIPNAINFIPGIRNCFKRTDIIWDEQGEEGKKNVAHSELIHSAHPTVFGNKFELSKDNKVEKLVSQNISHLQKTQGKNIILSGLISPLPFNSGEKKMHESLRDAVVNNKKSGVFERIKNAFKKLLNLNKNYDIEKKKMHERITYNNIPINMFRLICKCLFKKRSINNYMRNALMTIMAKHRKTANHSDSSIEEMIGYLRNPSFFPERGENALSQEEKKIVNLIEKLNNNLNHSPRSKVLQSYFSGKNSSVEMNSDFHLLVDLMNRYDEKNKSIPCIFCKSGKDRTGIQVEYSSAKILADQLAEKGIIFDVNKSDEISDENRFKDASKVVYDNQIKLQNDNRENTEKVLLEASIKSRHLFYLNGSAYGGNQIGLNGVLDRPFNVHKKNYDLFKENLYLPMATNSQFKLDFFAGLLNKLHNVKELFLKSNPSKSL